MGGRGSKDSGIPSDSMRTPPPQAAPPRRTSANSTGGTHASPGSFSIRSSPIEGNATTLNANTVSQWFGQLDVSTKIAVAKQMTDASSVFESQAVIALGAASYLAAPSQGAADSQKLVSNITSSATPMASALASLAYIGHGDTDCALVIANLLASLPLDPSTRDVRAVLVACIAVHPAFDANTVNTVRQALTKDLGTAPVPQRPELKIQELYVESAIATDVVTDPRSKRTGCAFRVRTVWSDGREEEAFRAHKDMFNFQCALLDLFPDDAILGDARQIPFLPGKKMISMRKNPQRLAESRKPQIQTYLTSLLALSARMSRCAHTVDFFKSCPKCRFPLAGCAHGCTVGVAAAAVASPGGAIAEADETGGSSVDGQVHIGRLSPTYTTGNPAFVQPTPGVQPTGDGSESGVQKATSITAMMTTDPNGIPEGEEVETMSTGNDIPTYTAGDDSEDQVEMRNRIGTLDDVRNSLFEPSGAPIPAPRS